MAEIPTPTHNPDLDALMIENPLDLTTEHVDKIIAYTRRHRELLEGGSGKKVRNASEKDKPKIDITKLSKLVKPKAPEGPRRF